MASARELGFSVQGVLGTDSSASKGMSSRRGAGKVRHLHTPALWLQQQIVRRTLRLRKLQGAKNGSDLGTKCLDQGAIAKCLEELGLEVRGGTAAGALRVAV